MPPFRGTGCSGGPASATRWATAAPALCSSSAAGIARSPSTTPATSTRSSDARSASCTLDEKLTTAIVAYDLANAHAIASGMPDSLNLSPPTGRATSQRSADSASPGSPSDGTSSTAMRPTGCCAVSRSGYSTDTSNGAAPMTRRRTGVETAGGAGGLAGIPARFSARRSEGDERHFRPAERVDGAEVTAPVRISPPSCAVTRLRVPSVATSITLRRGRPRPCWRASSSIRASPRA